MTSRISSDPAGKTLHRQPVPSATRIGNMIFSSAISGMDRETGEFPEDAEQQIINCFDNMRAVIEAAGGTLEDIGKIVVLIRDRKQRDILNVHWLKAFPDEHSRPVRHAAGAPGAAEMVIQMEFIAVVAG